MSERNFTLTEVDRILRRAGRRTESPPVGTSLTESELREAAAELGLPAEALETALIEDEVASLRELARTEVRATLRRRYIGRIMRNVVYVGLLVGLPLAGIGPKWFFYVAGALAVWGTLGYPKAFHPEPEDVERRVDRHLAKKRILETGERFGRAVGRGALTLMDEVAARIETQVEKRRGRRGGSE